MARNCSICSRPDAGAINQLLDGRSSRSVALEVGVSEDALLRHARNHVAKRSVETAVSSNGPAPGLLADDPLDELVAALRVRALAGNPADTREYRLALAAQSDLRHAAAPIRDLATEPEWLELRTAILDALAPFPKARLAVAAAIEAT